MKQSRRKFVRTATGLLVPAGMLGLSGIIRAGTAPSLNVAGTVRVNTVTVQGGGDGGGSGPDSISGLKVWHKASSLSLSDTDPVGSWSDSSGNGFTLSQATGTAKPTYIASESTLNNKPSVSFDGTSDFMSWSGLTNSASNYTVFFAMNWQSTGSNYYACDFETGRLVVAPSYASGTNDFSFYDGTWKQVAATTTGAMQLIYILDSGGMILRKNQAQIGTSTYTQTALGGAGAIGGRYDGTSNWGQFKLSDFGIYNRALSGTDLTTLESYLNTQYGV